MPWIMFFLFGCTFASHLRHHLQHPSVVFARQQLVRVELSSSQSLSLLSSQFPQPQTRAAAPAPVQAQALAAQTQQTLWPISSIPATAATKTQQTQPVYNPPAVQTAVTPPTISTTHSPLEKFSTKLFQKIAPQFVHTNVIYSPISLAIILAFLHNRAEGLTEQELQAALQFHPNKTQVAVMIRELLHALQFSNIQLIMASKLYHNPNLQTSGAIKDYAQQYFNTELEPIDFAKPEQASQQINHWVAQRTQNHIRNLVGASAVDARTPAMLVNAIYFKARWAKEFSTMDTDKSNFHINKQQSVLVDMMYTEDTFRFGNFPSLKASVLELPYKDAAGLSMLIILPHDTDGLLSVEQQLNNIDLSDLAVNLSEQLVTVRLPKFHIEFELDMLEPLKMLGIHQLFSDQAQLSLFAQSNQPVGIAKVQHKAYIDVNEAGSEAAAASFAKFSPLSLPTQQIFFTANHPFVFAIRDKRAVYFVGHVARF